MGPNRKFIICALLKYAIHFTDGDMREQSPSVIGARAHFKKNAPD